MALSWLDAIHSGAGQSGTELTNFDDIIPLIANFLDSDSFTVTDGGINSIRRCISAG